jgi:hypothetical protein
MSVVNWLVLDLLTRFSQDDNTISHSIPVGQGRARCGDTLNILLVYRYSRQLCPSQQSFVIPGLGHSVRVDSTTPEAVRYAVRSQHQRIRIENMELN